VSEHFIGGVPLVPSPVKGVLEGSGHSIEAHLAHFV
jgi:hypothetical protein